MFFIIIVVLMGIGIYLIVAGALFAQAEKPRLLVELGPARVKRRFEFLAPEVLRDVSSVVNRPFMHLPYLNTLQMKADFLRLPYGALELLLIKEVIAVIAALVAAIFISLAFSFNWRLSRLYVA